MKPQEKIITEAIDAATKDERPRINDLIDSYRVACELVLRHGDAARNEYWKNKARTCEQRLKAFVLGMLECSGR